MNSDRACSVCWFLVAWLAVSSALGACGGSSSRTDDAAAGDGQAADPDGPEGPIIDGGQPDAGSPDAGVMPFVCDPVHQTGCGVGLKCDIAASGTFACVPDGNLGDFRRCNPILPNACAAGFSCRGTFFGDYRCARLCNLGEDQCRTDEPCNSRRTTTDGKEYRMCATNQMCNPVLDDCSEPGKHCTFAFRGVCVTPGPVADGGLCQSAADCMQGSACLKAGLGEVNKCFKLCNPAGGAPACPTGVTCSQFATVGPQAVGGCGLL